MLQLLPYKDRDYLFGPSRVDRRFYHIVRSNSTADVEARRRGILPKKVGCVFEHLWVGVHGSKRAHAHQEIGTAIGLNPPFTPF